MIKISKLAGLVATSIALAPRVASAMPIAPQNKRVLRPQPRQLHGNGTMENLPRGAPGMGSPVWLAHVALFPLCRAPRMRVEVDHREASCLTQ